VAAGFSRHGMPPPASDPDLWPFDLETDALYKLMIDIETGMRVASFFPNLGTLGFWVLELFAMYATDGQTERETDGQKQRLLPPSR